MNEDEEGASPGLGDGFCGKLPSIYRADDVCPNFNRFFVKFMLTIRFKKVTLNLFG